MVTIDNVWHVGEVLSSWVNHDFYCSRKIADRVCAVMWVRIKWRMVTVVF